MKATPQITADFSEYPELSTILDVSIRRIVDLMELHDIIELRRINKMGVFDRPYTKDVITPIGAQYVPATINASRYAVGKALLDYLETIGVAGISLTLSNDEVATVSSIWIKKTENAQCPVKKQDTPPVTAKDEKTGVTQVTNDAAPSKPECDATKQKSKQVTEKKHSTKKERA